MVYDPLQPYYNRSYMLHLLDKRHFDELNKTPVWREADGTLREAPCAVLSLNGYCLDALDSIPGGSVRGTSTGAIQSYVQRDDMCTTPEYRRKRDARFRRLIDEVINSTKEQK